MKFPKTKTARDPKYLAWLRTLPCVFCGGPPPNEASHHGKHGIGIKPSDHEALPACRKCHQRHHDTGSPAPRFDHLEREERRDLYKELAGVYRRKYGEGYDESE